MKQYLLFLFVLSIAHMGFAQNDEQFTDQDAEAWLAYGFFEARGSTQEIVKLRADLDETWTLLLSMDTTNLYKTLSQEAGNRYTEDVFRGGYEHSLLKSDIAVIEYLVEDGKPLTFVYNLTPTTILLCSQKGNVMVRPGGCLGFEGVYEEISVILDKEKISLTTWTNPWWKNQSVSHSLCDAFFLLYSTVEKLRSHLTIKQEQNIILRCRLHNLIRGQSEEFNSQLKSSMGPIEDGLRRRVQS